MRLDTLLFILLAAIDCHQGQHTPNGVNILDQVPPVITDLGLPHRQKPHNPIILCSKLHNMYYML